MREQDTEVLARRKWTDLIPPHLVLQQRGIKIAHDGNWENHRAYERRRFLKRSHCAVPADLSLLN